METMHNMYSNFGETNVGMERVRSNEILKELKMK